MIAARQVLESRPLVVHRKESRSIAVVIGFATVATIGCGSTGSSQRPIPKQPILFVDAATGAEIPRVLILPKYTSTTGVTTGSGHGPGLATHSRALAAPFVYRLGEPFAPRQPDSKGLLIPLGLLFAGRGVRVNGIVVLVPGYQSAWVWELWDRPPLMRVPLDRLSEEESREHLQRLEVLLAQSRLRGSELTPNELRMFDSIADFDIEVAFDERDRRLVGEFLRIEQ